MARVDYFEIEKRMAEAFEADSRTQGAKVLIEEELSFHDKDIILIELDRRDAPPEMQSLAAGTRTRFELQVAVWCYGYALKKEDAMRARDKLVSQAELVLMENRQLDGKVNTLWLTGGQFENRRNSAGAGFMAGAEIAVTCDVTAINDGA